MAKFKLPEPLKSWKVSERLEDVNGNAVYKVSKKEIDGSTTNAVLTQITFEGENYNDDNVDYLLNEADFIRSIIDIGRVSNYIDVAADDNERKQKLDLFIVTEDIPTLAQTLQTKQLEEKDIVDFGSQMSEILEMLEQNKIFHGNIKPENIYVTPQNRYKLGGFIDAESKVNDLTYVAHEIQRNEKADYTTDIYSTGLVMYAMANDGKLPFEEEGVSPKEAMVKRFEGETVPAPKNGSEKLKSVIVIACQPDAKNRWKNAGNLKNALNAINTELKEDEEAKENVIIPETTEFEGNVFEQDNADDDDSGKSAKTAAAVGAGIAAGAAVIGAGIASANAAEGDAPADALDKIDAPATDAKGSGALSDVEELERELDSKKIEPSGESVNTNTDNTSSDVSDDNEIDNRVFDNYQTRVFSLDEAIKSGEKDYGDYFDEPEPKPEPKAPENPDDPENKDKLEDYTVFDDRQDPDKEEPKKSKKGLVAAIIIGIIVLLALLGIFGYFALQKGLFGGFNPFESTQSTTAVEDSTVQPATNAKNQQPTTAPATTAPTTKKPTDPASKSLIRVVGEPLDTARQMLEAEGYKVAVGEYYYDDFYYEGNVISQSPEAYTDVEPGSTITLNISLGPENKPTTQPAESSESEDEDSDSEDTGYSYSDSSYLSESTVKNMSRGELNLAMNEIYARHGLIFTDPELDAYFRSQDWYTPKYTMSELDMSLNEYEEYNYNLIYNEQVARGYR